MDQKRRLRREEISAMMMFCSKNNPVIPRLDTRGSVSLGAAKGEKGEIDTARMGKLARSRESLN